LPPAKLRLSGAAFKRAAATLASLRRIFWAASCAATAVPGAKRDE